MTGMPAEITDPPPVARTGLARRLVRDPLAVASLTVLVAAALSAVFAPLLAPYGPRSGDVADALRAPGGGHPLGTDSTGADVLSNLLYAGRFSLAGACLTLAVAALLGITTGLVAGYFRGWFETVADWAVNLVLALPGMIVLLAARAVLGPSLWGSMAIVGVLAAPVYSRVVRGAVLAVRQEPYIDAARVAGLSDVRIIRRHVLAVVRAPIIIQTAMIAGAAIGIQAGLEFVGLGDPNRVTWGTMLNNGFRDLYTAPLQLLWPSLAIGLVCVAFALLAAAIRDTLEAGGSGGTDAGDDDVSPEAADAAAPPEPSADDLLVVRGLRVGYGRPGAAAVEVVRGVDLRVRRGEVHGLVGESGSGKTQTAFAVLGVLPTGGRVLDGSVTFDGTELAGAPERTLAPLRGRRIGYIPQEPMSNLDPAFTIGYQLTEPIRHQLRLSRARARERALDLLDRVGIADPARTFAAYPHQISGGMAQRVLIAGAISCDPDLLIADEPTTALDVTVQAEVLDLLRDLQAERGMGLLLVTHDLGVVADLCDRVSVMRAGRIVETGPVEPVFAAPRHPYTRALMDAIIDGGPARPPLFGEVTA
ncbi:dipeptide/oligopeptide/nickel ABC transporter permease/ATP-binding protein [Spirillospora sp. CA-294931]|uniref:dipeptide/oligopeptide/nickel ABC transporter permease/ATP-binding protein n=1 Tax=Spirillospora sp. CA-294931 TaxID=3240042 RepID=UPI003D93FF53